MATTTIETLFTLSDFSSVFGVVWFVGFAVGVFALLLKTFIKNN